MFGIGLSHTGVTGKKQGFIAGCFCVNIGGEGKQLEKFRLFICKAFFQGF